MLRVLTITAVLLCSFIESAYGDANRSVTPETQPLLLANAIADKNFYGLRLLQRSDFHSALSQDATFTTLSTKYRERLVVALDACNDKPACYIAAAKWSSDEVAAIDNSLRVICQSAPRTCQSVVTPLRKSGVMIQFNHLADDELLTETWRQSASGIARLFAVYGEGVDPRYKAIDAISQNPQSVEFAHLLRTAVRAVLSTEPAELGLISDGEHFALLLLAISGRDEAGRFEPLERGENATAFKRIRHIQWRRYPYSAILVPGQGPEEPNVRLAPEGKLRLELAVSQYRAGKAPLIIVSGGYVHPARTPYCEAIEMKRALLDDYGIPPEAIVVEPHARHTTTNLRNTARLLFRYGAPIDKPAIVVSDERQAAYINTNGFDERNRRETGVIPYRNKHALSPTTIEFTPSVDALQVGFEDPLDP